MDGYTYQWAQAAILILLQCCPGLIVFILPLEGFQICDLLIPVHVRMIFSMKTQYLSADWKHVWRDSECLALVCERGCLGRSVTWRRVPPYGLQRAYS